MLSGGRSLRNVQSGMHQVGEHYGLDLDRARLGFRRSSVQCTGKARRFSIPRCATAAAHGQVSYVWSDVVPRQSPERMEQSFSPLAGPELGRELDRRSVGCDDARLCEGWRNGDRGAVFGPGASRRWWFGKTKSILVYWRDKQRNANVVVSAPKAHMLPVACVVRLEAIWGLKSRRDWLAACDTNRNS